MPPTLSDTLTAAIVAYRDAVKRAVRGNVNANACGTRRDIAEAHDAESAEHAARDALDNAIASAIRDAVTDAAECARNAALASSPFPPVRLSPRPHTDAGGSGRF